MLCGGMNDMRRGYDGTGWMGNIIGKKRMIRYESMKCRGVKRSEWMERWDCRMQTVVLSGNENTIYFTHHPYTRARRHFPSCSPVWCERFTSI